MKALRDWLADTSVDTIMTKNVFCLHLTDPLADAASLFLREQISGAPVVDDRDVCVGVLSATDILNFEEQTKAAAAGAALCAQTAAKADHRAPHWSEFDGRARKREPQPDEVVARFMTRDIVSVPEDAPLGLVVQRMVDGHVHRVLVLDSSHRVQGIVSTTDVLAALLRAGEWSL